MAKILVSGLVNWETNLAVEGFPIPYFPVRYPFFGVDGAPSGVGLNLAKALAALGDDVRLLSLVGPDAIGEWLLHTLKKEGIPGDGIFPLLQGTPQSVILFDPAGRRQIHTDLKDLQESTYPEQEFIARLDGVEIAVLCNVNVSRPLLKLAKERGKTVATDVHVLSELDDPYNQDFLAAADILFQSDEKLPCTPDEWIGRIYERFHTPLIAIGLGKKGVLLAVEGKPRHFPAVETRPIKNTIGAGDSLFASFLHFYAKDRDPYGAIQKARFFASWKIGGNGGSDGFLDEQALLALIEGKLVL